MFNFQQQEQLRSGGHLLPGIELRRDRTEHRV